MTEVRGLETTPLALILGRRAPSSDDIGPVLKDIGFAVLQASDPEHASALLSRVRPDVVFIDDGVAGRSAFETCADLRGSARVRPATPLVLRRRARPTPAERAQAYRVGAWSVVSDPLDRDELGAMLATFVRAKQDADAAADESLMDGSAQCYNVRGILMRAGEVTADVMRSGRPLSSVVVGLVDPGGQGVAEPDLVRELAIALSGVVRAGDTVGRLGGYDFVVIAPGTDGDGAERLAQRILHRLDRTQVGKAGAEPGFHAGYYGASVVRQGEMIPVDLLTRAVLALRSGSGAGRRIYRYAR